MCLNQPLVMQFSKPGLLEKMHLTGVPLNSSQELKPQELFTVCTQCQRVLLPKLRTRSCPSTPPSSIRVSRDSESEDQWINFEDISKSRLINLSHGLCSSCFKRMDAILVDSVHEALSFSDNLSSSPSAPSISSLPAARKLTKSVSSPILRTRDSDPAPTTPAPTNVLVVDDNKLQGKIHRRMVEQAGFKCDVAENGAQAIAMAQETRYHLVLMDLVMAGRDGWSTARRIRKNSLSGADAAVAPRIVAVTGLHIDDKLIKDCADAGMEDIIHKPVSPPMMSKLLSSIAEKATE